MTHIGTFHDNPEPGDELGTIDLQRKSIDTLREMLTLRMPLYQSMARESGFSLEFGDKTCFKHASDPPMVVIGVEQLTSLGITSIEKLNYAVMHELGHLFELRSDPEGYLKMIAAAKAHGPLAGVYFRLDNCLADVFVNHRTAALAPVYRSGRENAPVVKEIYRENLFQQRDFSAQPLCVQYADYLLNLGMDVADDIIVSPEVRAEIDKGIKDFGGETFSYQEYLKTFFTPVIGRARSEESWQATVTQRQQVIGRVIRPVFERLLKIDQEAGRDLSKFQEVGFGGVDFDPADLEKMAKHAKQIAAEDSLSPEEKQLREIQKQLKKLGLENGLDDDQANSFAETYARVQPMIKDLVSLWQRIRNKEINYKVVEQGHFREGFSADVNRAIDTFDTVQHDPSRAEVMLKRSTEEETQRSARGIRVRLVLDLSHSMNSEQQMVKDIMLSVAASMSTVILETAGTEREVKGELQVYTYETTAEEIIPLTGSIGLDDVAKAFGELKIGGGTNDHLALGPIDMSLSPEDTKRIEEGDLVDVLIEITDGDTEEPVKSRKLVESIESKKVRAHAIKLFRSGSYESGKFDKVWNFGDKSRGFRVSGSEAVPEKLYEILADVVDGFEGEF